MKKAVKIILVPAAILVILSLITGLLMPKYVSDLKEGSLIAEYYKETVYHDVIFIGDCEVYENFIPEIIWKEAGISSYIRGSAQQLTGQSYYLLKEMLEKETPALIVFNVLALSEDEQDNEAYNRMTVDGMKMSANKISSALSYMTEDEKLSSYIFPLLRFHSRWKELCSDDIKYIFSKPTVSCSGYLMHVGVKPADNIPSPKPLSSYKFSNKNMGYMEDIARLCRDENVQLLLIKAPGLYPYWYDEWDEQVKEFADSHSNVSYLNILKYKQDIGLDYSRDTFDAGMHLNVQGGEKLSSWFADWLCKYYDFQDHGGDKNMADVWSKKTVFYEQTKAQLELAEAD